MGDVIRDVTIRVSVENGNMKLGPIDLSGLNDSIKSVLDTVRKNTESIIGSITNAAEAAANRRGPQRSGERSGPNFSNVRGAAHNNYFEGVTGGSPSSPIKIGMPGYAQSVRDRAALMAELATNSMSAIEKLEALHGKLGKEERAALEKMAAEGQDIGVSEADLEKLKQKLAKRYEMIVKEYDREQEAARKAEEVAARRAEDARRREADRRLTDAKYGVSEWSRHKKNAERAKDAEWAANIKDAESGVAEWSRNKKKKKKEEDAEWASRIKDAETGIKEWSANKKKKAQAEKEEEEASQRQAQAAIQAAKGIGLMAAATADLSPATVKFMAEIQGLSQVASAATVAFGPVGGALVTAGAAATVFGLHLFSLRRELNRIGDLSEVQQAETKADFYAEGKHRRFEQGLRRSRGIADTTASAAAIAAVGYRSDKFAGNRLIEGSSSMSPAMKEEAKRRLDVDISAHESYYKDQNRINDLKKRTGSILKRRRDAESETNEIKNRRDAVEAKIEAAKENINKNPAFPGMGYSIFQEEQYQELNVKSAENNAQAAREIAQIQEDINKEKHEELLLNEQIAGTLDHQHKTLSQLREDAAATVAKEKEGQRQGKISFGMMSAGEQHRAMMLEKKHQRIMEQRAARDRGEDVAVERYNLAEKQDAQRFGGKSMQSVELQAIAEAETAGYGGGREHNEETVKLAEKRQERIEEKYRGKIGITEDEIKSKGERGEKLGEQISGGLERLFEMEIKIFEDLQRKVKEQQDKLDLVRAQNAAR